MRQERRLPDLASTPLRKPQRWAWARALPRLSSGAATLAGFAVLLGAVAALARARPSHKPLLVMCAPVVLVPRFLAFQKLSLKFRVDVKSTPVAHATATEHVPLLLVVQFGDTPGNPGNPRFQTLSVVHLALQAGGGHPAQGCRAAHAPALGAGPCGAGAQRAQGRERRAPLAGAHL